MTELYLNTSSMLRWRHLRQSARSHCTHEAASSSSIDEVAPAPAVAVAGALGRDAGARTADAAGGGGAVEVEGGGVAVVVVVEAGWSIID